VLASYTYALIISTLGSLRQVNAQHIYLYGEVTVGSKTFLLVQYADGKSRGKVPTLALIPLEDMRGSRLWFEGKTNTVSGSTAIFCGQNLTGLLVTQPRYFHPAR